MSGGAKGLDRAVGASLMADNGCQLTSLAFMRACAAMGIRQAFTSYNNPNGRFLRPLKEELVWLRGVDQPGRLLRSRTSHISHAAPLPTAC